MGKGGSHLCSAIEWQETEMDGYFLLYFVWCGRPYLWPPRDEDEYRIYSLKSRVRAKTNISFIAKLLFFLNRMSPIPSTRTIMALFLIHSYISYGYVVFQIIFLSAKKKKKKKNSRRSYYDLGLVWSSLYQTPGLILCWPRNYLCQ